METAPLSGLSEVQKAQVDRQLKAHEHSEYTINLLVGDITLEHFRVLPQILRPEVMVAKTFAEYLASHPELYKDKYVLDMGCGTGIQGIVTALKGAKLVAFSDISPQAVENTRMNVEQYDLKNTAIFEGDLFAQIPYKVDLIIFNHPFFPGKPDPTKPASIIMLDEGELLKRFLTEASKYLLPGGMIILPYFELAGPINDPLVQGPEHGYLADEVLRTAIDAGVQNGEMTITVLRPITPLYPLIQTGT